MVDYSKYPNKIDGSTELPVTVDLVSPVVSEVTNRLRDAIIKVQTELGVSPSSTFGSVKDRLEYLSGFITQVNNVVVDRTFGTNSFLRGSSNPKIGDFVYLSLNQTVDKADINNKVPVIGLVIALEAADTIVLVASQGEIDDVFTGLTPGPYYLSTDGQITNSPSNFFQLVGVAKTASIFEIQIGTTFRKDVYTSSTALRAGVSPIVDGTTGRLIQTAIHVPIRWDASSTDTDNGYTVWKPGDVTGAGRWVLDDKILDARYFGAQPDVSGGGDAIQDALDEFVAHPTRYSYVWIPTGIWKLTKGLVVGRADGFYAKCTIKGGAEILTALQGDGFDYLAGAKLVFEGTAAAKETFVLAIQAGDGVSITGVTVSGGNLQPYTLSQQYGDYRNLFTSELSDYVGFGVRTNRYSPQAGFVIDPFSTFRATAIAGQNLASLPGNILNVTFVHAQSLFPTSGTIWVTTNLGIKTITYTGITSSSFTGCSVSTGITTNLSEGVISPPGGDPNNCYPGWESSYQTSNVFGSINIEFYQCYQRHSYVGAVMSPSGFVGNGESIIFRDCSSSFNAINYAYCQTQSRGCVIDNPRGWLWSYLGIDTLNFGQQSGTPANIINGVVGGSCKYLFNVACNTQEFVVLGLYVEAFMSIGRLGYGNVANTCKLIGCQFGLMDKTAAGWNGTSVDFADAPFHLMTNGLVELDGCNFGGGASDLVLRIDNRGLVVMRNCQIWVPFQNNKVPCGFNNVDNEFGLLNGIRLERVILLSGNQLIQEHPEWSHMSYSEYVDNGGLKILHKTGESTGTILVSNTSNISVGDMVGPIAGGIGTQWTPTFISPDPGGTFLPWGIVTSVTANTSITLHNVPKGVPFDDSTGTSMQRVRWYGTATNNAAVGPGQLYTRDGSNPVPGDAVYISSSGTIAKAKADSSSTMPAIGIMVGYADNRSKGRVMLFSQGNEIQNIFSTLTAGSIYYVSASTAGAITITPPSASGQFIQIVGIAKTSTVLGPIVEYRQI